MEGMRKNETLCCTEKPLFFFLDSERQGETVNLAPEDLWRIRGDFLDRSKERIFSHIDGHPRPVEYYSHHVRKSEKWSGGMFRLKGFHRESL